MAQPVMNVSVLEGACKQVKQAKQPVQCLQVIHASLSSQLPGTMHRDTAAAQTAAPNWSRGDL
jgi:hypothetical protein